MVLGHDNMVTEKMLEGKGRLTRMVSVLGVTTASVTGQCWMAMVVEGWCWVVMVVERWMVVTTVVGADNDVMTLTRLTR